MTLPTLDDSLPIDHIDAPLNDNSVNYHLTGWTNHVGDSTFAQSPSQSTAPTTDLHAPRVTAPGSKQSQTATHIAATVNQLPQLVAALPRTRPPQAPSRRNSVLCSPLSCM